MAIEIMVDAEYNAKAFWDAMRIAMPELVEKLWMFPLWIAVTDDQWAQIQAMPGFARGPEHAKFAVLSRSCND
jgi:hypothetical protein